MLKCLGDRNFGGTASLKSQSDGSFLFVSAYLDIDGYLMSLYLRIAIIWCSAIQFAMVVFPNV